MPWVNVFDVGACRVEVYESGPVLIPEGDYAARGITVSTAGGVVSLTCASEVISLWEVRVVPSFATADLPVRLGAFAGPVYRAALWLDGGILDFANLTPAGDAYTPDPAQLSPPWNAAGIRTTSEAGTGTVSFVVEIEQAATADIPTPRTVRVRTSKDGGHVFADWRTQALGDTGTFLQPVVFRRFGQAEHWTLEVSIQSAAPFTLIAASVQTEANG